MQPVFTESVKQVLLSYPVPAALECSSGGRVSDGSQKGGLIRLLPLKEGPVLGEKQGTDPRCGNEEGGHPEREKSPAQTWQGTWECSSSVLGRAPWKYRLGQGFRCVWFIQKNLSRKPLWRDKGSRIRWRKWAKQGVVLDKACPWPELWQGRWVGCLQWSKWSSLQDGLQDALLPPGKHGFHWLRDYSPDNHSSELLGTSTSSRLGRCTVGTPTASTIYCSSDDGLRSQPRALLESKTAWSMWFIVELLWWVFLITDDGRSSLLDVVICGLCTLTLPASVLSMTKGS